MSDPEAWKKNIADIVGQKTQEKINAAQREQTRKDHITSEHLKARELLQGQPEDGFAEFATYLESQGENAAVRHDWDDVKGPWVGVAVSDMRGLIMDVVLQARISAGETKWYWVYELRGNRRISQGQEIQTSAAGPSKQYVIETLAEHYQKASANR